MFLSIRNATRKATILLLGLTSFGASFLISFNKESDVTQNLQDTNHIEISIDQKANASTGPWWMGQIKSNGQRNPSEQMSGGKVTTRWFWKSMSQIQTEMGYCDRSEWSQASSYAKRNNITLYAVNGGSALYYEAKVTPNMY